MSLYNPQLPPFFIGVSNERFLGQYGPGIFMLTLNYRALQNMLARSRNSLAPAEAASVTVVLEAFEHDGGKVELWHVAQPVRDTPWSVLDEAFDRVNEADNWTILEPEVAAQIRRWMGVYNSHSLLTEKSYFEIFQPDVPELHVYTPLGVVLTDGQLAGGLRSVVQAYAYGQPWQQAQHDLLLGSLGVPPLSSLTDVEQDALLKAQAGDGGPEELEDDYDHPAEAYEKYQPDGHWTFRFFFGTFSEDIIVPYPKSWEPGDTECEHTDYVQDYYDTWCDGKNRNGWEVLRTVTTQPVEA